MTIVKEGYLDDFAKYLRNYSVAEVWVRNKGPKLRPDPKFLRGLHDMKTWRS